MRNKILSQIGPGRLPGGDCFTRLVSPRLFERTSCVEGPLPCVEVIASHA
jgi:hypothetical protein